MHAAVLHTLGKPPRYDQFPNPAAGEGGVLVQVRAAGLEPQVAMLTSTGRWAPETAHAYPITGTEYPLAGRND